MTTPSSVPFVKIIAGDNHLDLHYDDPTPAYTAVYRIQIREVGSSDWGATLSTVNLDAYTVRGLRPRTQYQVRIKGAPPSGTDGPWSEALATTTNDQSPDVLRMFSHLLPQGQALKL